MPQGTLWKQSADRVHNWRCLVIRANWRPSHFKQWPNAKTRWKHGSKHALYAISGQHSLCRRPNSERAWPPLGHGGCEETAGPTSVAGLSLPPSSTRPTAKSVRALSRPPICPTTAPSKTPSMCWEMAVACPARIPCRSASGPPAPISTRSRRRCQR